MFQLSTHRPMSVPNALSAQNVMQGLTVMANLAQFDQSIANVVNAKAIAKDQVLNTYAWPIMYIHTDEEIAAMEQQQQSKWLWRGKRN